MVWDVGDRYENTTVYAPALQFSERTITADILSQ